MIDLVAIGAILGLVLFVGAMLHPVSRPFVASVAGYLGAASALVLGVFSVLVLSRPRGRRPSRASITPEGRIIEVEAIRQDTAKAIQEIDRARSIEDQNKRKEEARRLLLQAIERRQAVERGDR